LVEPEVSNLWSVFLKMSIYYGEHETVYIIDHKDFTTRYARGTDPPASPEGEADGGQGSLEG
jgi:hypothetical protein